MKSNYVDTGRRKQKLKTHYKIFDAAQVLMNKGDTLTLEKVAKEANISRATIYRYYSNIETLTAELALSIQDEDPERFALENKDLSIEELIFKIQNHYLDFTFRNEATFRKFLGSLLTSETGKNKRAGRRIIALEKVLSLKKNNLSDRDKNHLINIASLFMGVEALILTKDVCNLNDEEAKESLQWGLRMLLNSVLK